MKKITRLKTQVKILIAKFKSKPTIYILKIISFSYKAKMTNEIKNTYKTL